MRVLVISDIHANLPAFEAVLQDAAGKWDTLWCLGDVIGYGPHPNECVDLLCRHEHIALSGNHDWAVLDKLDITDFNEEARTAVLWTRGVLSEQARLYLETLPPKRVEGAFTLAHGSPRHPVWEYVLYPETAAENMAHFETPYCLVGHSHIPILFAEQEERELLVLHPRYTEVIYLEDTRVIINPGSVGQPRDSDPRAAYALLDLEKASWEFCRVPYAIAETQAAMRKQHLPESLIVRLEYGW